MPAVVGVERVRPAEPGAGPAPHRLSWTHDDFEERYGDQDPSMVSAPLAHAAIRLADAFDGVTAEQWLRTGRRSDGARLDIVGFSRYPLHDPVNHLFDVTGRQVS